MIERIRTLTDAYKARVIQDIAHNGLIVDTNLSVLYVYGSYDRRAIGKSKASGYSTSDYDYLIQLLSSANIVYITAHIATEISNLVINRTKNNSLPKMAESMCGFLNDEHITEKSFSLSELFATHSNDIKMYGIADTAIIQTALCTQAVVLTDDNSLYEYLCSRNMKVLCNKEFDQLCSNR